MYRIANSNPNNRFEQIKWCVENFAVHISGHFLQYEKDNPFNHKQPRWQWDKEYFYFRELDDLVLFKLRWS